MTVTIQIPDDIVSSMTSGGDASRQAIEALALEGYRSGKLTESQVRRLLGYETRMEVHGFLKDHHVFLDYTMEDLERERQDFAAAPGV